MDNLQSAVQDAYSKKLVTYATEMKYRNEKQIYYSIAIGSEVADNTDTSTLRAGTISELNLGLLPSNLEGEEFYEVTSGVAISGLKDNKTLYVASGTEEKHYITDKGEFFVLPGYPNMVDGVTRWYVTANRYYEGEDAKTVAGGGSNSQNPATPSSTTYTITYKDVGDVAFTGTHESGYPTSHTAGTATTLKGATKDSYTFEGWYTTSDGSGTSITTLGANDYSEDITLYAKWTSAGGITTTENGVAVTITPQNFKEHLGKIVTNYKIDGAGDGTETVTVGSNTYTVSKRYRLYWIDYENKFGDGAGTVYLKADCTSNNYALQRDGQSSTSKIVNMNPELYKTGVTAPSSGNNNMSAVTWLLDTAKWSGLKTSGNSTAIGNKVKYVVGAPSFEMMMDSYNAHYGLTGDAPVSGAPEAGTRKKLFYKFTSGGNGYQVGPGDSAQYAYYTADNAVYTDSIDSMYYPGSGKNYWLASPSASSDDYVMFVYSGGGGLVTNGSYNANLAFCPLVSLDSDVQLTLQGS